MSENIDEQIMLMNTYVKKQEDHKEGDVWEENGKQWTIKNGIKMTISKLDLVKKYGDLAHFSEQEF